MKKIFAVLKNELRALSPSCREASRMQSEALEHTLRPSKSIGLTVHLLICRWCRRYRTQLRFMRDAAREHPENMTEAVPQNLSPEARERIRQRLKIGE